MDNSIQEDYASLIEALTTAKEKVESVKNIEISSLTTRLRLDLIKHINFLKIRIGESPNSETIETPKPLTKVLGRTVIPTAKTLSPIITNSRDIEMAELKIRIENIYPGFSDMDTDQILDTFTDIEIRALAKKAGLPVTDNMPKRIDSTFITKIKEVIAQNMSSEKEAIHISDAALAESQGELFIPANDSQGNTITDEEKNGNMEMLKELTVISNVAILEAYNEEQIKEFADMVGITTDEKTKIDSKFVTQLKEAINKNK